MQPIIHSTEHPAAKEEERLDVAVPAVDLPQPAVDGTSQDPACPSVRFGPDGWPVPSSLSANPEEARARIQLPEFNALLLEKARVISSRYPFAEAECRMRRAGGLGTQQPDMPHFERVFRVASALASRSEVRK